DNRSEQIEIEESEQEEESPRGRHQENSRPRTKAEIRAGAGQPDKDRRQRDDYAPRTESAVKKRQRNKQADDSYQKHIHRPHHQSRHLGRMPEPGVERPEILAVTRLALPRQESPMAEQRHPAAHRAPDQKGAANVL